MNRRMTDPEERRIHSLFGQLARRTSLPPERAVQDMIRSASSNPRGLEVPRQSRLTRRFRRRSIVAAATAALLLGSGLGFGLASSLTPSGGASVNFVGFGFRPLQGWNVMQAGALNRSGVSRAVAANIPLNASDGLGGISRETLASLPARGALISTTFRLRGDPDKDVNYIVRELPLQLANAERLPDDRRGGRTQYRLRAGVGGYNVDVYVYFGEAEPLAQVFAAAQGQLGRLVVANERVTIRVQPLIATQSLVTVFGTVDGGRAGEAVSVQGKVCGTPFFRVVAGALTEGDGRWSTSYGPRGLTTLRAVWRDETSPEVTVRRHATIQIRKRSSRKIEVEAIGKSTFWRKRALIQRFDNRLGRWSTVTSILLTESFGPPRGTLGGQGARATFTLSVPRGTRIRAVFPRSQTSPCYLAGISNMLRT